jgi:hypothetical protein
VFGTDLRDFVKDGDLNSVIQLDRLRWSHERLAGVVHALSVVEELSCVSIRNALRQGSISLARVVSPVGVLCCTSLGKTCLTIHLLLLGRIQERCLRKALVHGLGPEALQLCTMCDRVRLLLFLAWLVIAFERSTNTSKVKKVHD